MVLGGAEQRVGLNPVIIERTLRGAGRKAEASKGRRFAVVRTVRSPSALMCFPRDYGGLWLGMVLALAVGMATQSQAGRKSGAERFVVRSAALLVFLMGVPTAAMAGSKSASMRVGAQVVASVRLLANATPAGNLAVETRSFGTKASALLIQQRSGQPLQLRGGARLPSEAEAPLQIASGNLQLALGRSSGPAEVVVTIFSDGMPPRG